MGTAAWTETRPVDRTRKYTCTLNATNAASAVLNIASYPDKCIEAVGTWDSATLVVQGANASTYLTLTDPQGNALSKTADFVEQVQENPVNLKVSITGGGGSESIVVTICVTNINKIR